MPTVYVHDTVKNKKDALKGCFVRPPDVLNLEAVTLNFMTACTLTELQNCLAFIWGGHTALRMPIYSRMDMSIPQTCMWTQQLHRVNLAC